MTYKKIQFEIDQLRKAKMTAAIESIMMFVFALFASAYLPQLLVRYVFVGASPFAQPKVLEYIPLAAFAIGVLYFLMVFVQNILRSKKIKSLEEELLFVDDGCGCGGSCGGHGDDTWSELDELDKIVEEAIAESKVEAEKAKKEAKKSVEKKSKTASASKKSSSKSKKTATKSKSKSKSSKSKKKSTAKKK